MKRVRIVLENKFHNTTVELRPIKYDAYGDLWFSKSQQNKAWEALCGIKECKCKLFVEPKGYSFTPSENGGFWLDFID